MMNKIKLEPNDRKNLIDLLISIHELTTEQQRRQMLESAGLDNFTSRINLSGDTRTVVGEIISILFNYGRLNEDQTALGLFLITIKDYTGFDQKNFIDNLLNKYQLSSNSHAPETHNVISTQSLKWLDGVTSTGRVELAPSTEGRFTGTKWRIHPDVDDGIITLECLGDQPSGLKWLYGKFSDGTVTVGLASSKEDRFKNTKWKIQYVDDGDDGIITLECLDVPDFKFLHGEVSNATVGLAPSTENEFTANTRWRIHQDVDNEIITLECLGHIEVSRWLDGRTFDGKVKLVSSTEGGMTGTRWRFHQDVDNEIITLECRGHIEGSRWLYGKVFEKTVTVGLALLKEDEFRNTKWKIQYVDVDKEIITLECLGVPDLKFLHGTVFDGTVGLAPSTENEFTAGTRWRVCNVNNDDRIISLKCLGDVPTSSQTLL